MLKLTCSVIVCTHNPRPDFFERVLESIRRQTVVRSSFELVVIDNKSDAAAFEGFDLIWHPNSKLIVESELGLTAARLRGFRESNADLIIFCDDDNVLAPDYLEQAGRIAKAYPFLGAWGGNSEGEFESPLPKWADGRFYSSIGIREFGEIHWSNILNHCCPIGAGMVLRRSVADAYTKKLNTDSLRMMLGRSGGSLMSGEDIDLANTASEIGMGTGVFPELKLKHLIPGQRLTMDYYEKLVEGISASLTILKYMQSAEIQDNLRKGSGLKHVLKDIYFRLHNSKEEYIIHKAQKRGVLKGLELIQQTLSSDSKKT